MLIRRHLDNEPQRGCCTFCLEINNPMETVPIPAFRCRACNTKRRHTYRDHLPNCKIIRCAKCKASPSEAEEAVILHDMVRNELKLRNKEHN